MTIIVGWFDYETTVGWVDLRKPNYSTVGLTQGNPTKSHERRGIAIANSDGFRCWLLGFALP
ncbi:MULTISPECIES: hypothetical protein [Microcystis]|uniref:Uncharacterized protein n=3 Tax=Microcystis TaxID=1125 RepID=A0A0A1VTH9_MICAE|nr:MULTISPECIES: hypothetical protein [Microcystis]TRT86393.1 MAG: hypothetical protein EWV63_11115 [Microcystis aeruginosa Ma_OC_H_19870700_S124]MBD2118288.1 hypothetical protein [Microcystis wesenbergii FACHB-1339]MCZ8040042.1 hypothetical protein [Microcystis sp. LE17-20A]MCZ8213875.1 hypothetical protein [Microcystis sp. LE19-8.1F]MDT3674830.1 hypothetical protein [Microcystis wesenbergii NRERC-220]